MSEYTSGFSPEEAKQRVREVIQTTVLKAGEIGVKVLVVGSVGIAGLTGEFPKLLRGRDKINGNYRCVDVDVLIGLPLGSDLQEVKECFDKLWCFGMASRYQVPVSPVNLPKEVANNPREVLDFRWVIGQDIKYSGMGRNYILPEEFTSPVVIKPFGERVETISPEAHAVFKFIPGWKNPLRFLKDVKHLSHLLRIYPHMLDDKHKYINTPLFNTFLQVISLVATDQDIELEFSQQK